MNTVQVSYPVEAHHLTKKIEDDSFWYQHRTSVILKAIKKNISGTPTIYDLGGGNGPISKALINNGYNCVLVEALPDAVTIAKERGIQSTILSTIQDFKKTELSVVLLADVLEHIEDDLSMLKQLYQQIAPGGGIVITVPAFSHITTSIDREIGHFRRYTTSNMSAKLTEAGFVVQQRSYFFSLLYLPFVLLRVLPEKLGFTKNKKDNRRNKEHLSNSPRLNKLAGKFLQWECRCIQSGIRIPFGTSCIVVATKS
ncbi:class I SAM-dependent methyltransferase [Ferruginibacter sp. SUN002]|uniref:class I SAM-dependent methyltransferase n=1 Tax=Ferruginibacter sp. SUN002 TaxID=2937789 RepID=UPI003D361C8C